MKPSKVFVLIMLCCVVASAKVVAKKVACSGTRYEYQFFDPSGDGPFPAILLLHGAGDDARNFIDEWTHLAKREHIVLIAPQLNRDPKFEDVALPVFRCIIDDAKSQAKIDEKRIYLFGHSAGGYLAYDGATLDSQYYAAAAIHGMEINADYTWIVTKAQRKTPIAIYIGDHDQFFSVERVRATRDLLVNAGFPVHYVELKHHDHNYYDLAKQINEDAWNFMKGVRLPQ